MPHPTPFIRASASPEPLVGKPRPRFASGPRNYKFLLGKLLFHNHDTKTIYDAEIRNVPLHLERLICSVFNLHGITLYYTIAAPPVVRTNPTPLPNSPTLSADTIADLLAP